MDITGWEPPKNAFGQEVSKPKSSREVKLDAYRQEMALKARQKKESGIQFAEEEELYDSMGASTAWQKPDKREDDKLRKQRLLEEWRARDERQKSRRIGEYGREQDDKIGVRDGAPDEALQPLKPQAPGVSNTDSTQARMGAAMSTKTATKGTKFTAGMERGAPVTISSRSPEKPTNRRRPGQDRENGGLQTVSS